MRGCPGRSRPRAARRSAREYPADPARGRASIISDRVARAPCCEPGAEGGRMAERVHEPAIDLVSIRWERVQLILDARPVAGTELDPTGFRLEHDAGRGSLPPTAVTREGDLLRIRINVMQGPDLQPLDPGRWRLLGRARPGDPAVPVRVGEVRRPPDPGRTADPAAHAAAFSLRGAAYRATPTITAERTLALDIDFETGVGYLSNEPLATRTRLRLRRVLARARGAGPAGAGPRDPGAWPAAPGGGSCSRSDTHGELTGNLRDVHARMVERGLDREYTLLTLFRPRIGGGRRLLDRLRLPWLLGAADVIVIDDFQPAIYRIGVDPRRPDRPAVARVGGVQDRRLQPGRQARRARSVLARPQELHVRHGELGARRAVLRRGVRHPGGARGPDRDPADGPLLRRRGAGRRAAPWRARRSRRPTAGSPSCSRRPSVATAPRTATYRLRPARLRGAPRAVRREGRGGHHPDASVRDRPARDPGARSATGCSTVRRPSSTSTTCCSRSTC